jgi:hypothetical protein
MPNFFLSHKHAKVARRLQPDTRICGRHAAIRPKDRRIRRRDYQQGKQAKSAWNQLFYRSEAMKLFTVISAGLVLAAASAQAQSPSGSPHYTATSDFSGPYAEMPPGEGPGYGYGPNGYGPRLLPAPEVYTVLRDNGFLPLGSPRQHGFFYTISVTDRRGDDGRLVIDARNGRIVRFMPSYRSGPGYGDVAYGPPGRMPPVGPASHPDEMRPPAPVPVPKMASHTPSVLPKPEPIRSSEVKPEVKPLAEKPAPVQGQQSAANQAKPTEVAPTPANPAPAPVEAKPATPQQSEILPTQEMPKVQGFE